MEVEKSVSWVADRENHVCPAQLNEPMPFSVQQNIGYHVYHAIFGISHQL